MHGILSSNRFLVILAVFYFFSQFCLAVNVKDFGARGDGKTDDTKAINAAVRGAVDGVVEFPRGHYRITKTVEIVLSGTNTLGLRGKGGSARIIMAGEGPAFSFIGSHDGSAAYNTVKPVTFEKERMPVVEDIEIIGANPKADGLLFHKTFMPVFKSVMIRDVHHGIHFTNRERNVIIDGCHIYHCTGIGIYLDSVSIHQMIIGDSHISYCREGGIKIRRSEIRNLQITGNDIEYNYDSARSESADIWVDCSLGGSVREGTISGNTIQAIVSPGGANIRFTGAPDNPRQTGLWSITGNHISNQSVNIELNHAQGISITGNSFIRGSVHHIVINDSKNIVVSSNVFDYNEDYYHFKNQLSPGGGISVMNGQNIILSNNIIDKSGSGTDESGGAVILRNSEDVTVTGCQIITPDHRGILVEESTGVMVSNTLVKESSGSNRMMAGIELKGACNGTVIKGNSITPGRKGQIVNNSSGAVVE